MNKKKKIAYWFFTCWLALGMTSTGIVQLLRLPEGVQDVLELGYPAYFLTLIGVWKLLGVVAVLLPRLPVLKEWAYAGFFFLMTGAMISHIVSGHGFGKIFPSVLLLTITLISWALRPVERKVLR